jgi:hypothetical protein
MVDNSARPRMAPLNIVPRRTDYLLNFAPNAHDRLEHIMYIRTVQRKRKSPSELYHELESNTTELDFRPSCIPDLIKPVK